MLIGSRKTDHWPTPYFKQNDQREIIYLKTNGHVTNNVT